MAKAFNTVGYLNKGGGAADRAAHNALMSNPAGHASEVDALRARNGANALRDQITARAQANRDKAHAGAQAHASDVPAKGGGGHGGNPNHDEHGRFA